MAGHYPIFYDVVRYGETSGPWDGGSYKTSYRGIKNSFNDETIPVIPEIIDRNGNIWDIKLELPTSINNKVYVPVIIDKNGKYIRLETITGGIAKIVGDGGPISIVVRVDVSSTDNPQGQIPIVIVALGGTDVRVHLDPITNEVRKGTEFEVINPSGIIVSKTSQIQIEVIPAPDSNNPVTWSKVSGSGNGTVSISSIDNGTTIEVTGINPGELILEANVPEISGSEPKPRIKLQVVPESEVKIFAASANLIMSESQFTTIISKLNEIYKQIGIKFVLEKYFTDVIGASYNVIDLGDSAIAEIGEEITQAERNHLQGIEIYVVEDIVSASGLHHSGDHSCIIIDSEDFSPLVVAHEIGHSLGLEDIYQGLTQISTFSQDVAIDFKGKNAPHDASSTDLTSAGYYRSGTKLWNVIQRLLMNGKIDASKEKSYIDIPFGTVDGLTGNPITDIYTFTENIDVGVFENADNTRNPNHND